MKFFYVDTQKLKNSRWDPNYWNVEYGILMNRLKQKTNLIPLKDLCFIDIGKPGKRIFIPDGKVKYITVSDLLSTGIDYKNSNRFIETDSVSDKPTTRILENDVFIVVSGSVGKISIAKNVCGQNNISQDVAVVRSDKVTSEYLYFFLMSKWGQIQINRFANGTGITHLNVSDISEILIPMPCTELNEVSIELLDRINRLHFKMISDTLNKTKYNNELAEVIACFEKSFIKYLF